MDREYERLIVKTFFNKRYQERIIYELSSEKKRKDAIRRLSHNWNIILNSKYLKQIKEPCSDYTTVLKILEKHGADDVCYSISFCEEIDAKFLHLPNAIEHAFGYGLPSLIICKGNNLAYFEAEQECGAPPRFILER
ncbi:MAG: hypothetical protein A2Y23_01570 [Clostridiales bacterium GWB2_37_7]|nr:MAG: hypothetical protein A2Y23_01570 [Clostridiales bacterium GWB2_37_7]